MKEIDINSWKRREVFDFFSNVDYPFYSITLEIEVTKIKEVSKAKNISFYYLMIWACTQAINSVENFQIVIKGEKVFQTQRRSPSFTDMKKGEDIFHIVTLNLEDDFEKFCHKAKMISVNQSSLFGETNCKDELIYFTCLPWFDFKSLTNERNFDKDDVVPRIAWGKYHDENGKLFMNLNLDVNHRTIDGFHIGLFKENLDKIIAELA